MKNLITILFLSIILIGCKKDPGKLITLELDYSDFNGIELIGSDNVFISYGAEQAVTVSGPEEIIKKVENKIQDSILILDKKESASEYFDNDLTYEIILPIIKSATIFGSGDVLINEFTQNEDLDLKVEGSGNINFNKFFNIKNISAKITGSGDIKALSDFTNLETLYLSVTGSGDINGYGLKAKTVTAKVTGSGNIKTFATENLEAKVTGSGDIYYRGNPTLNLSVTGSGKILEDN